MEIEYFAGVVKCVGKGGEGRRAEEIKAVR